ncbi:MAG: bifunctional UDP-sugar hydrolase/5'-nucleotidase [Tabrizicola sp.]|uniref:bifunctional metallophosphatase/5'-nucleotidase n=1 Tax=Tabrizicola sp. TaxID=2005166 RepID=UPI0027334EB0|nr:bifunctional UDP-sugar hydrolase/5'-nucleotidase [Tabrizicola sp.]MDP3261827.1 bifunctional UDP-sugar hydrolase/5'-nucleotidase [Tabrizicola sp.]MDP3649565.1 bifunctional UDP-sugar hydrolase/5'-nucleotidase [Paracoccaceae bacterium]MDZ4069520.1 bifunctional UDP-sugar hydrolase/5'-nucleotidase [Tabrizicola sp.]
MQHFRRSLTRSLLASAGMLALAAPLAAETVKLTLLGVGDVYNFEEEDGRGGFARLNAVALAERAANPNTLYLFNGDMLSPSLISGFDMGQNTIDFTNLVPFDLAVPGNHEFDFGPENFIEKMKASKYPWAAINITNADGSPIEGLGGVTVKEVGGLKVALIPVAQDTSPEVSSTGSLKFLPTVDTGIEAAKAAREAGADIVVGVVQTNMENDRALMASRAFDVILSGDDHTYATAYDGVTAYVETSVDAQLLTPIDLTVEIGEDDGKRTISWTPAFRFIDTANVTPDPASAALADSFRAKMDETLNVEIGTLEAPLDSRRNVVRSAEATMGNLIADAMRDATGADIAIMNGGGIRGDTTYEAGAKLTRRDILTELPFGNVTVVTELPGSQVLLALENGASQVEKGAGRFAQVSGVSYTIDPTAEPGSRVSEVMVGGAPLEADKVYTVAVNDYIIGGGDGYDALGGGRVLTEGSTSRLVANDVMAYVEKLGTVKTGVEGRIKILGQ